MSKNTNTYILKLISAGILGALSALTYTSASFLYQEIDPICSISGKTHTSFPGEISDTSAWSIPKAYDGECVRVPVLKVAEKKIIGARVIDMFNGRNMIKEKTANGYILTSRGQKFAQDVFFPAIQKYIVREMKKTKPRLRNIAILNHAVSVVGYDYFVDITVRGDDYAGLSVEDAQELANKNNTILRVVKRDGEFLPVTMDYRPGRINAEVEDGIVINYTVE